MSPFAKLPLVLAFTACSANLSIAAPVTDLARNPQRACDALKAEGLPTSAWTQSDDPFGGIVVRSHRCLSEALPIRGGGSGRFVTALSYFVEGRVPERVETIRLVLNVHAAATRPAGLERFAKLAERLFTNLGISAPRELSAAIAGVRPGSWQQDYGTVRFEIWQEPIERLRLTILPLAAGPRP